MFSTRNLALVCACAAFFACVLNPHPLPPEGADDRAGGFGDSGASTANGPEGGAPAQDASLPGLDASVPPDARVDAALDGAADSGDAGDAPDDANSDANSDATADAPATDAGTDGDAP